VDLHTLTCIHLLIHSHSVAFTTPTQIPGHGCQIYPQGYPTPAAHALPTGLFHFVPVHSSFIPARVCKSTRSQQSPPPAGGRQLVHSILPPLTLRQNTKVDPAGSCTAAYGLPPCSTASHMAVVAGAQNIQPKPASCPSTATIQGRGNITQRWG
jgi:hypothetical protein